MTVAPERPAPAVTPTAPPEAAPDRFRPSPGGWAARGVVVAAVAAATLWYPLLVAPDFRAGEFTNAIVFALAGLSLNVLIGYTGTLSLGHQAFVGIGAFTSAYVVTVVGGNELAAAAAGGFNPAVASWFVIGLAAAALIGCLQAAVLGLVSLRISGLYFALITLAYGILAQESLFNIETFTGGAAGQPAPNPFGEDFDLYYLCALVVLGAVLYVDRQLIASKGGRALLALRENPRVAQTFSIDVNRYTLVAFATSGTFAGLAGAVRAHNDGFVVSNPFDFQLALLLVIVTVVGGLRSRAGIIVSAVLFSQLKFFIEEIPGLAPALGRWDLTLPWVLIVAGAVAVAAALASGAGPVVRRRVALTATVGGVATAVVGVVSGSAAVFRGGLALVLAATVAVAATGRAWSALRRPAAVAGVVGAALGSVVLAPGSLPGVEPFLAGLPVMTPEVARVVLAPVLLLVVLTTLPGGLGQLIRPVQHWLRGNRFDWSVGVIPDIQITDVRA